jgi:16S rRNA A1518/A1519 N6-dimethyltransferase RsmA/KsgA/DIM1 with predicted DNA glycosylase/AP lyase activity
VDDLEQHFLVDPVALAWIATRLGARPGERVMELGAGAGSVAAALRRTVAEGDLTLVELDLRWADRLRTRFPAARVVADDWRRAWARLPVPDRLVVSLPATHAQAVLDAIAARPPAVTVLAVAAGCELRLPAALEVTERRALPADAFDPPQPFAGEAWVVRAARRG